MSDVSLALAFAAGFISFLSPCVLALLPVYLAFLGEAAGATPASLSGPASALRQPVIGQAVLFVLGFTFVFIVLGTSAGLLGAVLFSVDIVRQIAGMLVIALGVVTTGVFGPVLDRMQIGFQPFALPAARPARSLVLGSLVAIGWTPCIGPVLGLILTMGASTQDAWIAALLLVAYSAGLAVPFLAAAVALPRLRPLLDLLRRHHRSVQILSGLFIVAIGIMIYLDLFARIAGFFTILPFG